MSLVGGTPCSGECCVCEYCDSCLAGHNDDYFIPATSEKIIKNLDNRSYESYEKYMIKYLKETFGIDYDYLGRTQMDKEKEIKMRKKEEKKLHLQIMFESEE